MSKVSLNISLPETLADITLGQYQEYLKIVEKNKDDENATDFLNLKALEVFCGLALKESYNLPVKHFKFALEHLDKCFKEETPHVHRFTFRDLSGKEQEMGFIPKLDDMSFGEYTDLDEYVADWSKMHLAMAVLYRPVRVRYKDSYQIAEYEGTEQFGEDMKNIPVSIALGAVLFFYRLGMRLSENMIPFLEGKARELSLSSETLLKNGAGIRATLRLQMETLLDLMRQQRFHSIEP